MDTLRDRLMLRTLQPHSCRVSFKGIHLRDISLSGLDLRFTDFSQSSLMGVNFSRANLYRANLSQAFLILADLSHTDLSQTNLTGAFLIRANLRHADLNHANFTQANLTRADLQDVIGLPTARFDRTILQGAILPKEQRWKRWIKQLCSASVLSNASRHQTPIHSLTLLEWNDADTARSSLRSREFN